MAGQKITFNVVFGGSQNQRDLETKLEMFKRELVTALNDDVTFVELSDVPSSYDGNENKFLSVNADGTSLVFVDAPVGGGSGGSTTFTGLTDTPAAYTSAANKLVAVNSAANALEFIPQPAAGITTFIQLSDTPGAFTGAGGKIVSVNAGATALEFTSSATLPASASQVEAETGTEVELRSWSPLRVAQAAIARINALLGNVNNTSDANKPVSTAQQAALDLKANSNLPVFTGKIVGNSFLDIGSTAVDYNPNSTNWNNGGANIVLNGVDFTSIVFRDTGSRVDAIRSGLGTITIGYDVGWGAAAISLPGNLTVGGTINGNGANLTGLTKVQVGLPNVDNTSDINKPVSTAQQTALNLKANTASPTFTGTVVTDKVGIGTPNVHVNALLQVFGGGGRNAFGGATNAVVIGEAGGFAEIGGHTAALNAWADLIINSGGGNVGFGKTNPATKVDVNGTVTATALVGNGAGITGLTFKQLTDTPANFTGAAGKIVSVNAGETALEFTTPESGGSSTFTALTDTPADYVGKANSLVVVNPGATALEFITPQHVRVTRATDFSIPSNTTTIIPYTSTQYDTNGLWVSTANTRLTAKVAGYYQCFAFILFTGNSTGARSIHITKNGVRQVAQSAVPNVDLLNLNISIVVYLAVNDYIEGTVFQSSGAALIIIAGNGAPTLGMSLIGP